MKKVKSYKLPILKCLIFMAETSHLTPLTSYLTPLTSYLLPLTSFDISHLQAGIYFVRISTEKGVVTKKVVKQ